MKFYASGSVCCHTFGIWVEKVKNYRYLNSTHFLSVHLLRILSYCNPIAKIISDETKVALFALTFILAQAK